MKTKEDTQKTSINNSLFSFLNLSTENNIGDRGVTSLSESLKSNTTLTQLILGCEYRRRQKISINSLDSFLFSSTDNKIGDTGVTSLSESLKSNTTLTALGLCGGDKRKKTHKRNPSTIHSSHFSKLQQTTILDTQVQHH